MGNEVSNYITALKSRPIKQIEMSHSKTRQALIDQDNKCAKCKKELNPSYCKYVEEPKGHFKVYCSNCAVPNPGKRN